MIHKVVMGGARRRSKSGKLEPCLPVQGLNELLAGRVKDYRSGKYRNPIKSDGDKACRLAIRKYLRGIKLTPPIEVTYHIFAPNKLHDRGNLYTIDKYFLDSLQEEGILENDKWDFVLDSTFITELDKSNPRIEIEIREVGSGT